MTEFDPMVPQPVVSIVLATFNGSRYLSEQLDSILAQSLEVPFEIVIRDDMSEDSTMRLLESYRTRHADIIRILPSNSCRLGPKDNFITLLSQARGQYIAFCDQDDFWEKDKLRLQLAALQSLEARRSTTALLLCCSDAFVTDESLQVTSNSYFKRHGLFKTGNRDLELPRLLFRNYAIGATTMINRSLALRCISIPKEAVMHDWWACLLATCEGSIEVIHQPLIRYRQHGGNAIGSKRRGIPRSLAELNATSAWARASTEACLHQAAALYRALSSLKRTKSTDLLRNFDAFSAKTRLQRLAILFRTRAFKPGFAVNCAHIYACMAVRSKSAN